MTRRTFVSGLAVLAACLGPLGYPNPADAQQPASPRHIGVLLGIFSPESKEMQAFRQGLLDAGYSEGRDVVIEWRSVSGDYARVPELVADLVRRKVEVIVVTTTIAAQAVKRATSTIPIVMVIVADPVGSGLVTSLAHPGGNVTGLSNMASEVSAKRMQLLKETIPRLTRVAVLWNPDTPYHTTVIEELKAVARPLSIKLSFVGARTTEQFARAFSVSSQAQVEALYVIHDNLFFHSSNDASQAGVEESATNDLPGEGLRKRRRPDVLRGEHTGPDASIGRVRRQDPQGRQAKRSADRATDAVRISCQSQDGESVGHHDS